MSKQWWKKPTSIAVAIFVLGAVPFMLAFCEDASADFAIDYYHDSNAGITDWNKGVDRLCFRYYFETETSMGVCPLVAVGGDTRSDSFEINIVEPLWPRWEGQISLIRFNSVMDGGFTLRRMIGDGPFQLAIGGTLWVDESPGSNSDLTYNLGMRYRFGGGDE